MQHHSPDALIATPTERAPQIMEALIAKRAKGYWEDPQHRREFRMFGLSRDGKHTHYRIAQVLGFPPEEVRRVFLLLMVKQLVTLQTITGREVSMNVDLLSSSFQRVKQHGITFAEQFYHHLFALADTRARELEQERTHLQQHHALTDERASEIASDLTLYQSVRTLFLHTSMKEQCRALLGALSFIVAEATKNQDIQTYLSELGQKHRGYGVRPEHYPLVGQVLLASLQAEFGPEWTEALEHTWRDAFDIVSSVMIKAAEQGPETPTGSHRARPNTSS